MSVQLRILFYTGLLLLLIFEVLNIYLIMPLPGSQESNTVELAYFLYQKRLIFRIVFLTVIVVGSIDIPRKKKFVAPLLFAIPVIVVIGFINLRMSADKMFLQPAHVTFHTKSENTLNDSSIVLAVQQQGEAKAYPIRYIQYHHQVRDTLAGRPIMVTYCNVCRTGRVFEPVVNGKPDLFRLAGMDHFNAMFEDENTRTWWRQATGEAVAGPLKGETLAEVPSTQLTLNNFFSLHPFGRVMAADPSSVTRYDSLGKFERGKSTGSLTRTDSMSWRDKSWVIGIEAGGKARAYDWNELLQSRLIHDTLGGVSIVLVVGEDNQSFSAFTRKPSQTFTLRNDSLVSANERFDLAGRSPNGPDLGSIAAYQEFWHSWKQFHPDTQIFDSQ